MPVNLVNVILSALTKSIYYSERRLEMKSRMFPMVAVVFSAVALFSGLALAGDLNPPAGGPTPTMKTLDQIPPTWSQRLQGEGRWAYALPGATAHLDKETGLVWMQGVDQDLGTFDWDKAVSYCINLPYGGRKGWRLPTIEELGSLVEPGAVNPALPEGHPFGFMGVGGVWSVTTSTIANSDEAWVQEFLLGNAFTDNKCNKHFVICVRGGQGRVGQ